MCVCTHFSLSLCCEQKIADKQRAVAEKKGSKLQRALDVRFADTKFLGDATEQLLACRRVLRWSYVYGFYVDKSLKAERNLFLYLQEELEKNTNRLRFVSLACFLSCLQE
jgi:ariadne-1